MKKKKLKLKHKGFLIGFFILLLLGGSSFYLYKSDFFTFLKNEPKEVNPDSKKEKEKEKEPEVPKKEEYQFTLGMIGDALYHGYVYKDHNGSYNFDHQLAAIAPIIEKYDLAYYNQETILGGKELGLSGYPCFNSPQEVGDAFVKAGFDLVSLANNHSMDTGEKAILKSTEYWRKQEGVMTAGSYDSVEDRNRSHIGEKNGITYAFLAYTYGTNGIPVPKGKDYLVNVYSNEQAKKDIEAVRDKVDVVLVSMHWGVEYTHVPTNEQKAQAQFLADLGVDVIIGSHPHVIQPIEHIGKTVVIYSLGNAISNQSDENKRIGMLASLTVHKTVEDGHTTISIDEVKGDLICTLNDNHKNYRIVPMYQLTNALFPNYETVKKKYEAIINKNDSTILVGTLGEA